MEACEKKVKVVSFFYDFTENKTRMEEECEMTVIRKIEGFTKNIIRNVNINVIRST